MPNYRPATAADVGRRIEISNTGEFDTDEWCYLKAIGAKGRYICDHGKDFEFARVPILPDECEPPKWYRNATPEEREELNVDVTIGVNPEPIDSDFSALLTDEPIVHTIRRKLEEPYWELQVEPGVWRKLAAGAVFTEGQLSAQYSPGDVRQVTHATAEQAILLDGKLYPVEWVKSSPGVLPQQCEIV